MMKQNRKAHNTVLVDIAARLPVHPYSSSLPASSNLVSMSRTSKIRSVGTMLTRLPFSFCQAPYAGPPVALLASCVFGPVFVIVGMVRSSYEGRSLELESFLDDFLGWEILVWNMWNHFLKTGRRVGRQAAIIITFTSRLGETV